MVPTGAPKLTLWPFGNTISLFSIGVTCRFSSSQSLSFTSTAATDWAIPADAQETTVAPSTSSNLAMYSPVLFTRSFISKYWFIPAIAASTTSGRGVETPSAVMRPEVLITCFKWYFSKIEGMFRAPLFGQIAFARADRGQWHQNVVSLEALFFGIHQQRGPVLQAK